MLCHTRPPPPPLHVHIQRSTEILWAQDSMYIILYRGFSCSPARISQCLPRLIESKTMFEFSLRTRIRLIPGPHIRLAPLPGPHIRLAPLPGSHITLTLILGSQCSQQTCCLSLLRQLSQCLYGAKCNIPIPTKRNTGHLCTDEKSIRLKLY